MTQTKIVVKVNMMSCDKCRTKAMKIAAVANGVKSVKIDGDKVEVVGDGVDPICLTRSLRKKFCYATLESVGEKEEEKKEELKLVAGYVPGAPFACQCYEVSYGSDYWPGTCSIL